MPLNYPVELSPHYVDRLDWAVERQDWGVELIVTAQLFLLRSSTDQLRPTHQVEFLLVNGLNWLVEPIDAQLNPL